VNEAAAGVWGSRGSSNIDGIDQRRRRRRCRLRRGAGLL